MSLGTRSGGAGTIGGVVRVDRRTKNLVKRLQGGDIAVIDHEDLDRVSADGLVACSPAAVVNAAASISGRYPNAGPLVLIEAGIPVLDNVGSQVIEDVQEGAQGQLDQDRLLVDGQCVATGTPLTRDAVDAAMEAARQDISEQLAAFAENTMRYLVKERDLLIDGVGVPPLRTDLDGRQVLIVVRGHHYQEDLVTLGPYIREYRPIMIGVDGGADAILAAGYGLHLIVGDMDSVSDEALTCGAEIVVHAYRDGTAPGLERVNALGVDPVVFPAAGTSEDVAMLLADHQGASLIVAVGTHATLEEFLDKGRAGMASTFLTRLRVGGKLVDAKGVSRLYRQRIANWQLALLLCAGFFALLMALQSTASGQVFVGLLVQSVQDVWNGIQGFFRRLL
ncbi:MAG: thiamin pyrophosphokinase [Micrococcales bacterium]|nr:MAG: thiamin pyrophosphokinase [Micrococcales bacterium]PIE26694.1 MAG: thiamin pyrophosphokinase [Micrococcales bacterium]